MPAARHVLQADHPDYGTVCPECASPKHRQSKRCAQCYYDARRRGEFPPPPVPTRKPVRVRAAGGSRGRRQPQSHPWRGKNALLFATHARALEEVASASGDVGAASSSGRPTFAMARYEAALAVVDAAIDAQRRAA